MQALIVDGKMQFVDVTLPNGERHITADIRGKAPKLTICTSNLTSFECNKVLLERFVTPWTEVAYKIISFEKSYISHLTIELC